MEHLPEGVIRIVGSKPGKTVAVFCGIHGNERAGIMAVDRLLADLKIEAGTVYFAYANQQAIARNVRYVERNLNRLFSRALPVGTGYEAERAVELMGLLDGCDALLDLHSYREPVLLERATPFAICEADSADVARRLPFPIVIQGFSAIQEGGTDGYMFAQGKVGICVELGALECGDRYVGLGMETVRRFLVLMGCLEGEPLAETVGQRRFELRTMYRKASADFAFARPFRGFDPIEPGATIATDGGLALAATGKRTILFPHADGPIGVEAFLLAEEV